MLSNCRRRLNVCDTRTELYWLQMMLIARLIWEMWRYFFFKIFLLLIDMYFDLKKGFVWDWIEQIIDVFVAIFFSSLVLQFWISKYLVCVFLLHQPIYGFASGDSLRFKRASGLKDLYYIDDKDVELRNVRNWRFHLDMIFEAALVVVVLWFCLMDAGDWNTIAKGTAWYICCCALAGNWRRPTCYTWKCSSWWYIF